jgi:YesN/AraC family two-component response regulator
MPYLGLNFMHSLILKYGVRYNYMEKKDFKILIVDDEELIRETLKEAFEDEEYSVITASGGDEALEIVRSVPIDFVLTDIKMPKGDGIELLDNINMMGSTQTKVVLISGFSEYSRKEVVSRGAFDLYAKPFKLAEIMAFVNDIFEGKKPNPDKEKVLDQGDIDKFFD